MFVIWRRLSNSNSYKQLANVYFQTREQVDRWLENRQWYKDGFPVYVFEEVDAETVQRKVGCIINTYCLRGHELQELHKMT